MKREYKVINQPLSLRHRVAQPGAEFSSDEVIGGEDELKVLIAEKRVDKIADAEPEEKSDGGAKVAALNAEIERLSGELADALVKVEGQKAEIEKITALLDKKGVKELKEENEALKKENEALKDEVEALRGSMIDLDADGAK